MTRLIDADALISELLRGINADTDRSVQTEFTKSLCMILCKAIEKRPTVDAVPVRLGKWIDITESHIGTCSLCGDRWGSVDMMNYCPNCGARMDEDE